MKYCRAPAVPAITVGAALFVALGAGESAANELDAGAASPSSWPDLSLPTPEGCSTKPLCELSPNCDLQCPSRITVFGVRIGTAKADAEAQLKKRKKRFEVVGSSLVAFANNGQVEWFKQVQKSGNSLVSPLPVVRYEIDDEGGVSTITVGSDSITKETLEAVMVRVVSSESENFYTVKERPYAVAQTTTTYLSGRRAVTSERELSQSVIAFFVPDVPVIFMKFVLGKTAMDGSEIQLVSERGWPKLLSALKEEVGPHWTFLYWTTMCRAMTPLGKCQEKSDSFPTQDACEKARQGASKDESPEPCVAEWTFRRVRKK